MNTFRIAAAIACFAVIPGCAVDADVDEENVDASFDAAGSNDLLAFVQAESLTASYVGTEMDDGVKVSFTVDGEELIGNFIPTTVDADGEADEADLEALELLADSLVGQQLPVERSGAWSARSGSDVLAASDDDAAAALNGDAGWMSFCADRMLASGATVGGYPGLLYVSAVGSAPASAAARCPSRPFNRHCWGTKKCTFTRKIKSGGNVGVDIGIDIGINGGEEVTETVDGVCMPLNVAHPVSSIIVPLLGISRALRCGCA